METENQVKHIESFPTYLSGDVKFVVTKLESERDRDTKIIVTLSGETIQIPDRIYINPPQETIQNQFSDTQKLIVACLFTRHHDGLIREKYLKEIINSGKNWTIPFIIQLLGEYVIEIIQIIQDNLSKLDKQALKTFLIDNNEYFQKTQDRVRSYWQCYYRNQTKFEDYVGQQIIVELKQIVK
jgi:hypothetical protein